MATLRAISDPEQTEIQLPFLPEDIVDGAVDYRDRPIIRSRFGGWRSACFIILVELAERIAYYGIASNLITYLTGHLGQSTAAAAANVNAWSGVTCLLPLLGAIVADSFLGRFRTIVASSLIYILGLGLLTLSAFLTLNCESTSGSTACDHADVQVLLFIFSLYLVAIGQSGHKPCVQAFGADQFDEKDPKELKAKSSFFNWWYFGLCLGHLMAVSILNYIQDNLNWALGFGIPCILMIIALPIFLLGTPTYRYFIKTEGKNPLSRISHVFVTAARNCNAKSNSNENLDLGCFPSYASQSKQFGFLNKALLPSKDQKEDGAICTVRDVEEAKSVLRLLPIWASCLVYAIVFAQYLTFFTKQGATMDRSIGQNFTIPAAALQSFMGLFTICLVPIYDRILVPVARHFTGEPAGITKLQRIGTGLFISIVSMVIAALIESMRLEIALEYRLIDSPDSTVPMKVWWLIPQYALIGIADVFSMVGLQEFFYDQVPSELRSVGLSLYLSIIGMGSLLSSLMVSGIEKATSRGGQDDWFADNLNRAHLNYFYWLLAGLSCIGLMLFMYFARSYVYKCKSATLFTCK